MVNHNSGLPVNQIKPKCVLEY